VVADFWVSEAKRFIQIVLRERAYGRPFFHPRNAPEPCPDGPTSPMSIARILPQRQAADLRAWLEQRSCYRQLASEAKPHGAVARRRPIAQAASERDRAGL
jgi:hypothetical protein